MSRAKEISITLVTADADGIALSQTTAGAGNLVLAGALTSGGTYTASDAAHKIEITSSGNESAKTFTITGTDQNGKAITEVLTGPNIATVTSNKFFRTVTQIAISAATAGNVTAGTADEIATQTLLQSNIVCEFNKSNVVDITGTINHDIEHTYDDLFQAVPTDDNIIWFNDASHNNKSADFASSITTPVSGTRLVVNSYSAGATIRWRNLQVR